MKKITLLIPDDYSDVLSVTAVASRPSWNYVSMELNVKTHAINLMNHNNETYKIGLSEDESGWVDEE